MDRVRPETPSSIATPVIDGLTGLGNRQYLDLRGSEILRACEQAGGPYTALHFIIDQPVAKDGSGPLARLADPDIKSFATRLAEMLHDARLLARYGETEFVGLVPGDLDSVRERTELLRSQVHQLRQGARSPMTFSAGLVQVDFQSDLESALSQGEVAARRARALGGDRTVVVDANESGMWLRRRLIEQVLNDAIATGDFVDPFLQPVVDLASGHPLGFEMLLRFKDARLANMPLMECISVAEESGQIHAIGHHMLVQACALLARRDDRLEDKQINVNVSVRQLMRREFVDDLRRLLSQYRINPRQLCFEVTETTWLDADGIAREILAECGSMGVQLALDDFGTGYASIAMLQSLPFGTLKVDRRFVAAINTDGNGKALCAALLAMAKACNIEVVAEGVENEAQARSLLALGYRKAQGFLWGRPMRMEVALRWLQRRELMRVADAEARRVQQLAG
jgi:EAL domain-containing protein (putative c-di-GMP-specific phosphodiesterase class I)